ncbi:MAG: hypothetical protein LAP86_06590 [Acidobacteriia bacterium]|nr:hypothetical protein [Terriglobia bacterium]
MAVESIRDRQLFDNFRKAYPDVSGRLFRDLDIATVKGLKPLPSFVATRIGLYLLRRFHVEKYISPPVEVDDGRWIK